MVKNHLIRIAAPKSWELKRKENMFIMRPNPGKKLEYTLALTVVLRDMLKVAKTTKEARYLIMNKGILVNGKRIKDYRYPFSLLDLIEIKELDEKYRLLLNQRKKLVLKRVDKAEDKPYKVISKKTLKGNKIQFNLFDGSSILGNKEVKTGDSITIENKKIKDHFKLETGAVIYLIGGRHTGKVAKVEEVKQDTILLNTGSESFETLKQYVFVIGKDHPIIKIE